MTLHAIRMHDFSYGHTVHGHEGACKNLHGHNGRVTFYCEARELDSVGRVVDFSVIKKILCQWLEDNWDHRFLIWENDPRKDGILELDSTAVVTPFNPTAENLALHLIDIVGPTCGIEDYGVKLVKVEFEETRKCSVCVDSANKYYD